MFSQKIIPFIPCCFTSYQLGSCQPKNDSRVPLVFENCLPMFPVHETHDKSQHLLVSQASPAMLGSVLGHSSHFLLFLTSSWFCINKNSLLSIVLQLSWLFQCSRQSNISHFLQISRHASKLGSHVLDPLNSLHSYTSPQLGKHVKCLVP